MTLTIEHDSNNIFTITNNFSKCNKKTVLKWGKPHSHEILISIVIPVYRNFDGFKKALSSAINQTYDKLYSIIIVDNNYCGDLDKVNEYEKYIQLLNSNKIIYFKNEENIGPVNNFNSAILNSNSEYVVMCHEDDELTENCLSTLLNFKQKNEITNELILSPNILIDSRKNKKNTNHSKRIFFQRKIEKIRLFDFFLDSLSNGCGCLINRKAFIEIGGFNPDYYPSPDYALLSLYAYRYGAFRINNSNTYKYNISDQNDSNNVFYKCLECDIFFRKCMKSKICLPDTLLDIIIKSNHACHMETTELLWTGNIIHKASLTKKIIMFTIRATNKFVHLLFK
jgi:glycosyltransferase involved in cell wall biosynthesis